MSAEQFEQAGWATDNFTPPKGRLVVTFHEVQKLDKFQSEKQGRPVFRPIVHIKKYPNDPLLIYDQPVTEADKEMFPQEWAKWERTKETKALGTPIENWHSVSETQKAEFRAISIFTIEQFAGLPDSYGQKIMNFNELREKAKVFVASGKDAELVGRIREEAKAENDKLRAEMDEMRKMIAEMSGKKK